MTSEEALRQQAQIEMWLRVFHPLPGTVVELRGLGVLERKAVSVCHSDLSELARHAVEWDAAGAKGVYFTLNPLRPELANTSVSAKKTDVIRRHWLGIDVDPVRESGTNSTDTERQTAWSVLDRVRQMLTENGIQTIVIGDSGNGWHCCCPIDLPADDDAQTLIKTILKGLHKRCSEPGANVDVSTNDAPRIWKMYGTRARKSPATEERPHRWARIVESREWGPLTPWDVQNAAKNTERLRDMVATWQRVEDRHRGRPESESEIDIVERARRYVAKIPPAVSGNHGHDRTFEVAQALARGFALSRSDSWEILLEYSARCQPPWSEKELLHKIETAERDSRLPLGYLLAAKSNPQNTGRPAEGKPLPQANADNSEDPLDQDATAADLIAANVTIRWGWNRWLPAGVLTVLASEPGVGKTRVCADLARRVYLGLPWPDGADATFPVGSRTLWVPADNQHAELGTLPTAFGFAPESLFLNATKRNPFGGTMLDAPEDLWEFEARILRVRPAIVVVDTALNATDKSSHKPEDAKAFFVPLQQIAARTGVVMVCVTHLNAAGKPLGRRIMGQARVVMQLEKPDPDQHDRRKLYVVKSNSLYPAPLGVTLGENGNEYDDDPPTLPEEGRAHTSANPQVTRAREWLAAQLAGGERRVSHLRTAADSEGISPKTLYRAKDQLKIVETTDADGKKWWRMSQPDEVAL